MIDDGRAKDAKVLRTPRSQNTFILDCACIVHRAFLRRRHKIKNRKSFLTTMLQSFATAVTPVFLSIVASTPQWVLLPVGFFFAFLVWFVWPSKRALKLEEIEPNVRASAFAPDRVPKQPLDVIVIGSGSGGCACANMLAHAGYHVLVLEQHPDHTGGCTHSFVQNGCEWDTGLHYTAASMGQKTTRPGALLNFMTKGLQHWTPLRDPYDQVIFPPDNKIKEGCPNASSYSFVAGVEKTVDSIMSQIDPQNTELRRRALIYMDLCTEINDGFTALGLNRILPRWLHWTVQKRVDRLMKFASMTVRDVQYALFNLGYTADDLIERGCPKAPQGPEPNPVLRRLKAVLCHPIGK
jgi:all-trans-retinol 13,14-reductase